MARACLASDNEAQPTHLRLGILVALEDLDHVAVVELRAQRHVPAVDLRADRLRAEIGMNGEGEVDRRRIPWAAGTARPWA